MAARIEFFWEPSSPYTYIASTQIEALAQRAGAQLAWKPMLLGKVFEATGNRMNIAVPAKARYMFSDLELLARHYRIPLKRPEVFPVNSVAVARAALAAPESQQPAFAKALLRAYWGEGRDTGQPDEIRRVAASTGLDGDAVLAGTQQQGVKDRLRSNTEEAIARGVFGAPTFFVGEQMFWGCDRLDLMEEFLAGKLAAAAGA